MADNYLERHVKTMNSGKLSGFARGNIFGSCLKEDYRNLQTRHCEKVDNVESDLQQACTSDSLLLA